MIRQFVIGLSLVLFSLTAIADSSADLNDDELLYVSATVYGEGYLEGEAGMLAILEVIENRAGASRSLKSVCLQPFQFSAWNDAEPTAKTLRLLAKGESSGNSLVDAAFLDVVRLVESALANQDRKRVLSPHTRHYWAPNSMNADPYWYNGEPTQRIGGHIFAEGVK